MSIDVNQQNQSSEQIQEQKQSDKEINFARIRKQLEDERYARQQAEQRAQELERLAQENQNVRIDIEDDHADEPYVDHKRLEKRFAKFEQKTKAATKDEIKNAVNSALAEERKNQWLKANPDFYEIMGHAQTFAEKDPELAETILQMPDTFERQKLVYKNIKALNLHKKPEPQQSIQDKVDQNRRSPYYQPSGVGSAPYGMQGDYSPAGQQNAYKKMQELKQKLRI